MHSKCPLISPFILETLNKSLHHKYKIKVKRYFSLHGEIDIYIYIFNCLSFFVVNYI